MSSRKGIVFLVGFAAAMGIWLFPHWAATQPPARFKGKLVVQSNAQESARVQGAQQPLAKPNQPEEEGEELPRLGLPIKNAPDSILSFSLPPLHVGGFYISRVRLVVLSQNRLQIFRPEKNGKLVSVFSLQASETEQWYNIQTFPSQDHPGIIIQGDHSEDAPGGLFTIAVCHIGGNFRVVLRGEYTDFQSIVGGKMPEAFECIKCGPTQSLVRVWVWNGKKYRPVLKIRGKDIYSAKLVRAVQKATPKKNATKPPGPKPHEPMI